LSYRGRLCSTPQSGDAVSKSISLFPGPAKCKRFLASLSLTLLLSTPDAMLPLSDEPFHHATCKKDLDFRRK